ncbi:MAG: SPOR domain-containing protein [Bacteroidales bacterium]|nr:SPOR domain-containing protein [Bacteroidales bacterium]MCF8458443.1 SPOR domain-containing protein [Bacteroidales bacterium]
MKSHYLYDLLRQHSRVIIPNFGAFLLKVKPQSDSDSDLQITFNDFLKFNDGLLIDYVSQTEQIDKYEAEHQVKEYVSKIQNNLINDGVFEVEGLGTIFKDEKGGLKFAKSGSDFTQPDVKPDVEKSTSKTGLSPLIAAQEARAVEPVVEKLEKPAYEIPKKESTDTPIEKPMVKPLPKKAAPPPKPPKPPKKKKKLLPIWRHILTIAAVLLIVLTILYLAGFFDSSENASSISENRSAQTSLVEGNENSGQSQGDADDQAEATQGDQQNQADATSDPSTAQDNAANTEQADNLNRKQTKPDETQASQNIAPSKNVPASKPVAAQSTSQTQSGDPDQVKPFHIIAGSFTDKGNAYNFVLKLRSQGFDSRIVNKHNGFYRVSFNSYTTKAEALSALPTIRNNNNPDAWFLYHKVMG